MTLSSKSSFIPFTSRLDTLLPERPYFKGSKSLMLKMMTVDICCTFQHCNRLFEYKKELNPRRVLTKPSIPCKNDGFDNEHADFILYVHGCLGPPENEEKYTVMDVLGAGTFGQVARCRSRETDERVAIKVIKNKPAYTKQSMIEIDILTQLNNTAQDNNVIQLKESFLFKNHLCLVFELLSINLYELLKQNRFKGLSTNLVRVLSHQLLQTLSTIHAARIIHCDLKPENILLRTLESPAIKVIDFGSACYHSQQQQTYIQSRFYRSPEVLLGLEYGSAIDMWSLGCIVAELFLGLPLLPGSSEYNQLTRIMETVGEIPPAMIRASQHGARYFTVQYRLKSLRQYAQERHLVEKPSKRYFSTTDLHTLVLKYPMPRKDMTQVEVEREMRMRRALLDFLRRVLQVDPEARLTPEEAMAHPFITGLALEEQTTKRRPDGIVDYCDYGQDTVSQESSTNSSSSSSSEEERDPYVMTGMQRRSLTQARKHHYQAIPSPFLSPPLDS